jgi:transposase
MLCAAIDIHKHVFQAVVVDPESGVAVEDRFPATHDELGRWAESRLGGEPCAVAIEATTGWRWVHRELSARGIDVRLAEPLQTRALRGRRRGAKTDRLDARWLALLLARQMLPESWAPPPAIQRLRDLTRLRKALAEDRTRWGQRLHAFLAHEGWACQRGRLLTETGRRWVRALALEPAATRHAERLLGVIEALEAELAEVEREVRAFAREDARARALQRLYGIGPIIACALLAEIGEAARFRRAAQIVRLAGLDPVVEESAEAAAAATWPRPARPTCAGPWSRPRCRPAGPPTSTTRCSRGSPAGPTAPGPASASPARSAGAPSTSFASWSSPKLPDPLVGGQARGGALRFTPERRSRPPEVD